MNSNNKMSKQMKTNSFLDYFYKMKNCGKEIINKAPKSILPDKM